MIEQEGLIAPSFQDGNGAGLVNGELQTAVVGKGLRIKAGANGRLVQNAGPMVGGTVVVANSSITANTVVLLSHRGDGAGVGFIYESRAARVAGVSFTVDSTNVADTGHFDYLLIEPS